MYALLSMPDNQSSADVALDIWRQHGGTLRTRQALALGIHPRTIYALRDAGLLEPLARGLYRLADLAPLSNPDLVAVALKIPRGVVCLISALVYHDLTTQVPHVVSLALERGERRPRLDYPPLQVYWFSGPAWRQGIETHLIEGTPVRIYGPAKTIADCFKHRRQVGLDVALEALRTYRRSTHFDPADLLRYARIDRVDRIVRLYLEALA
jgi:predicted transcriptional regulator of viral defense system